ncbi:hypothetical protein C8F04DRAFT_1273243 [Mycena alexandri]|uniref:Uncharacterized protein n=1 Tax=Mycena alexandri TaxID=1745969 RepID=A0AAD6WP54_9AGAR|nr:hypothetical protein C8F04DRAFT_1273243 [Mycena alexandri]
MGTLVAPPLSTARFYTELGTWIASAATQGGMNALEELRLLKVRDVSRVCNAVATGDLTQKITVPVQGDLMVQLKKARHITPRTSALVLAKEDELNSLCRFVALAHPAPKLKSTPLKGRGAK